MSIFTRTRIEVKQIIQVLFFLFLLNKNCYPQWVQTNSPFCWYINNITASDTNLFAGSIIGVFRSTDQGANWIQTSLTNENVFTLSAADTNLFAGTLTEGVMLSTDQGETWNHVNNGLTTSQVNDLAILDTNIFAGTLSQGIFRSTNNGQYWFQVNNGLSNIHITALMVSDTNIFAGTEVGIFLSANNGTNWTPVNNGLIYTYLFSLDVSDTVLFAGMHYYGGAYRSTDNGTSWNQTSLQNMEVRDFAVSDSNIFAGTDNGIYFSTDYGGTWTQVNNGLSYISIWALTIANNYLFAGTYEGGIWRRPLSEMITNMATIDESPKKLLLLQNYPNPFNPTTTIQYTIGSRQFVKLKVYDMLGNEIATLVNEEKPAGEYEVTFDGTGLPSGIYFYQLQIGGPETSSRQAMIQTKKMVYLK